MPPLPRRAALALIIGAPVFGALAGCGRRSPEATRLDNAGSPRLNALIERTAKRYDVPADLVHRVVKRESNYNPAARNGPYYGLMQILPETARTMGYRGTPEGLLDAETNLTFGTRYLRGAWLVARGNRDRAVMWYARGYYYEAKRMGLLKETGLRA
jgi:soluble lytic murein transglycosylase-like protein